MFKFFSFSSYYDTLFLKTAISAILMHKKLFSQVLICMIPLAETAQHGSERCRIILDLAENLPA
jgi:hypothetical protein